MTIQNGITFLLPEMSRAGGPRVTVEMANRLLEHGYNVNIACGKKKINLRSVLKSIYLSVTSKHYQHWGHQYSKKIIYYDNLLDACFPDNEIVISVGTKSTQLIDLMKGNFTKVRFCHGFDSSDENINKKVWSGDNLTITVSNTLVQALKKYGNKANVQVIPNGIRKDQYFPENFSRDGIGMIYETHPNKAPEHAETLIKMILEKWPSVPLYIFGSRVKPAFIPNGSYWQYPSIAKSRELYNRAKIWLIPSRMEGLPGQALEAMACGSALISTNNPGSAEIITHGKNGLLVPVDQPEAFLEHIDLLLSNEKVRSEIVEEAYKTVDFYSWERAVDKMCIFLNNLVENR